jgi:hypothetical protein
MAEGLGRVECSAWHSARRVRAALLLAAGCRGRRRAGARPRWTGRVRAKGRLGPAGCWLARRPGVEEREGKGKEREATAEGEGQRAAAGLGPGSGGLGLGEQGG